MKKNKKSKIAKYKELLNLNKIQLIKIINTRENELETLKEVIKEDLFKLFMDKLSEPAEMQKLKNELKNVRKKNKLLKSLLKGDSND